MDRMERLVAAVSSVSTNRVREHQSYRPEGKQRAYAETPPAAQEMFVMLSGQLGLTSLALGYCAV